MKETKEKRPVTNKNQLLERKGGGGGGNGPSGGVVHLFANNRDATFIGSIKLEHALFHQLGAGKQAQREREREKTDAGTCTQVHAWGEWKMYKNALVCASGDMSAHKTHPNSSRERARIVDVLPVPGGP